MRFPRNLHRVLAGGALAALAGCNLLTGAADLSTDPCEGCETSEGGVADGPGGDGATLDGAKIDTGTSDGSTEGQGGVLDLSFGMGGIAELDLLVDPTAVAVRGDGRIVVAGSFSNQLAALALMPNGSILTTFGTAGRAIRGQGDSSVGRAVVFDGAGRALVGGSSSTVSTTTITYAYVVRFGDVGTDGTFGNNGGWRGNSGGEIGTGIAISPGDGIAMSLVDGNDHKVVALTVAGDPDPGFGNGGTGEVPSVGGAAAGLVRVADGWVTGGTGNGPTGRGFAAAKLTLAGVAENDFGTMGKAFSDVGANDNGDTGTAVAVQADGAILVGGHYDAKIGMTRRVSAITRFTPAGAIDLAYGTAGKIDIDLTEPGITREADTRIVSLFVDSKGRTIVVGSLQDRLITGGADRTRVWVGRLLANGTFDPKFGTQGKMFVSTPPARVDVAGGAMQADGKIVVVGRNAANNKLFVARVMGSTTL